LALTSTGAVYAWGFNGDGELGTTSADTCATFACSKTPVAVSLGGATVKAIAAGWDHSLAIRSDDTPVAWGLNNYGHLGDGTTTNRPQPGDQEVRQHGPGVGPQQRRPARRRHHRRLPARSNPAGVRRRPDRHRRRRLPQPCPPLR